MKNVALGMLANRFVTPVTWQLHFSPDRTQPLLSVDINSVRFRVGRRDNAELVLTSPQISGLHAEFAMVGMRLFVRDLTSTNGTYVNGKRIGYHDVALRHGDQVRMANVEFVVHRRRVDLPIADTTVIEKSVTSFEDDHCPVPDPASIFD